MSKAIIEKEKDVSVRINRETVLFVCSGNTCRSPMCAALFNHKYAGMTMHAESAGLMTDGSQISRSAVYALRQFGVRSTKDNDYLNHISKTVDSTMIEQADRVVAVSSFHAMSLIMRFPQYASKITSFERDIPDPFGGDDETYKFCLGMIDKELSKMFLSDKTEDDHDGNNHN